MIVHKKRACRLLDLLKKNNILQKKELEYEKEHLIFLEKTLSILKSSTGMLRRIRNTHVVKRIHQDIDYTRSLSKSKRDQIAIMVTPAHLETQTSKLSKTDRGFGKLFSFAAILGYYQNYLFA